MEKGVRDEGGKAGRKKVRREEEGEGKDKGEWRGKDVEGGDRKRGKETR